jgi:4-amino-4-deoxy-L-arabinose transferase-like glycosyltransferase
MSQSGVDPAFTTGEASLAQQRRMLMVMVLVALALRLAVLTIGGTYKFPAREDHFSFGWETGRIARSIAIGEGFSSPFHGHTGPTAWIAPLYPYFLAGLFKQVFGERIAKWTAWTWAVLPYSIYWAIRFAWETSFAAFVLSAIFLLALRMESRSSLRGWISFGLLWALIALSNPSLLAFLPFCGLWIAFRQRKNQIFSPAPILLSAAVFLLAISPWLIRNYRTFDRPLLLRGNFGAELRMGNGPAADGTWMFWLHPTQNKLQLERYSQLGEVAYEKERRSEALHWIAENPGRFAQISLKRAFFYWFGTPRTARSEIEARTKDWLFSLSSILALLGLGTALKRHVRGAWLFLWLTLSVPMIYYFTFSHPRYRHPIEPELLLLIVYVLAETKRKAPDAAA